MWAIGVTGKALADLRKRLKGEIGMGNESVTEAQHVNGLMNRLFGGPRRASAAAFPAEAPAVPVAGVTLANAADVERKYMEDMLDRARPAPPRPQMRPVNETRVQQEDGDAVEAMVERMATTPRTITGQQQDGSYAMPGEHDIRRLVQHAMKPGEHLMAFYARTGLGPAQLRSMSAEEISAFVERADNNNEESNVHEPKAQPDARLPEVA